MYRYIISLYSYIFVYTLFKFIIYIQILFFGLVSGFTGFILIIISSIIIVIFYLFHFYNMYKKNEKYSY